MGSRGQSLVLESLLSVCESLRVIPTPAKKQWASLWHFHANFVLVVLFPTHKALRSSFSKPGAAGLATQLLGGLRWEDT